MTSLLRSRLGRALLVTRGELPTPARQGAAITTSGLNAFSRVIAPPPVGPPPTGVQVHPRSPRRVRPPCPWPGALDLLLARPERDRPARDRDGPATARGVAVDPREPFPAGDVRRADAKDQRSPSVGNVGAVCAAQATPAVSVGRMASRQVRLSMKSMMRSIMGRTPERSRPSERFPAAEKGSRGDGQDEGEDPAAEDGEGDHARFSGRRWGRAPRRCHRFEPDGLGSGDDLIGVAAAEPALGRR